MSRKVVNAPLSKASLPTVSAASAAGRARRGAASAGSACAEGRALLGIDENGLGPLLGPLVVTAVRAQATEKGERYAQRKLRGQLASRLGDSKGLVAYGESALGEAWARALLRRAGVDAKSPHEVFAAISLREQPWLRELCPAHHHDLCFRDADSFVSREEDVGTCLRDLDDLDARGVSVVEATTVVVCNRRINDEGARGVSRFSIDLFAMEDLFLSAAARAGAPVIATAGKVGGFDFYGPRFAKLGALPFHAASEGKASSRYTFEGLGEIAFVRDADDSHLLVGLASLVGKWVRDRLTSLVVEHLRAHDPTLPDASGYHDPVTRRLVESSRALRARHRIEDRCFLREPAKKEAKAPAKDGRVARGLFDPPPAAALASPRRR